MAKAKWELPNVLTLIFLQLFFFAVAVFFGVIVGKLDIRTSFYSIGLAFLITILLSAISAYIGSSVARHQATQQILVAEEELEEKLKMVAQQAEIIQKESQEILHLPDRCRECAVNLKLYIDLLKQITELVLEKYGVEPETLISLAKLIEIEGNVKAKSQIWVMTSALELEETILKKTIFKNIKKRVKYIYFLPKGETMLIERLIKLFKEGVETEEPTNETKELLTIYTVPNHFVYMTVLVYDADAPEPTVLVKLPQRKIGTKEKFFLSFKVPSQDAKPFINSLHQFMGKSNVCSHLEKTEINLYERG